MRRGFHRSSLRIATHQIAFQFLFQEFLDKLHRSLPTSDYCLNFSMACLRAPSPPPPSPSPSAQVPITLVRTMALYREAGLPDGVLQIVNGAAPVVQALCAHKDIAAVTFVGASGAGSGSGFGLG